MTKPGFRKGRPGGGRAGNPAEGADNFLSTALFSQAQILHLMRNEFARARRHGLPLGCLLLQADRLAQLVDLHRAPRREVDTMHVSGAHRESALKSPSRALKNPAPRCPTRRRSPSALWCKPPPKRLWASLGRPRAPQTSRAARRGSRARRRGSGAEQGAARARIATSRNPAFSRAKTSRAPVG